MREILKALHTIFHFNYTPCPPQPCRLINININIYNEFFFKFHIKRDTFESTPHYLSLLHMPCPSDPFRSSKHKY